MRQRRGASTTLLALSAGLLLAACTAAPTLTPTPPPVPVETSAPEPSALPRAIPTGETSTVVTGLDAPWSIAQDAGGGILISERDTGLIRELHDGALRDVALVPGVSAVGEGGLLGLAAHDGAVYAFLTTASDNRIVRFPLSGESGALSLGEPTVVLAGIPSGRNHNGGRLAFGPDGMLYATTGDAGDTGLAQNPDSLAGKILRMTPDGAAPTDNPFAGSLVYSLGHRNPQGLAWDDAGQLWAAEFGQDTWDELNLIEPGANYGWPLVEGLSTTDGFVSPMQVWNTDIASPSGLAFVRGTLFLAGLGGERMWSVDPATAEPFEHFAGDFGRIRDVVPGPDGSLWILTNNTDGRGNPRADDDRIVQVELGPIS